MSYTLYRWELNIRVAAVLGFVGAGGLGQRIHIAISLFLENQLLTYLIFIYALVTIADYLSAYLRRRVIYASGCLRCKEAILLTLSFEHLVTHHR